MKKTVDQLLSGDDDSKDLLTQKPPAIESTGDTAENSNLSKLVTKEYVKKIPSDIITSYPSSLALCILTNILHRQRIIQDLRQRLQELEMNSKDILV